MRIRNLLALPQLICRSFLAARYARRKRIPGLVFDSFGRRLGARLLARGCKRGIGLLLNPCSIVRYFEFDYVAAAMPNRSSSCLDVSSPRLFSFWLTTTYPQARVLVINPDHADISWTQQIANKVRFRGIETANVGVEYLASHPGEWDFIYSISVIEHIAGNYDDRDAIRLMWEALKPGGTLALTFPLDRQFRDEYRDRDYYGTQGEPKKGAGVFFQRHYDAAAIQQRLLEPIGLPEHEMRFFGERSPGWFDAYEKRWMKGGLAVTVEDPREIADHYQEYRSWEEMPGQGVCGLKIAKPS